MSEQSVVEKLARELRQTYNLSSRCVVNLEGTIFNMLHAGLSIDKIKDFITDLYDNLDVLDDYEW